MKKTNQTKLKPPKAFEDSVPIMPEKIISEIGELVKENIDITAVKDLAASYAHGYYNARIYMNWVIFIVLVVVTMSSILLPPIFVFYTSEYDKLATSGLCLISMLVSFLWFLMSIYLLNLIDVLDVFFRKRVSILLIFISTITPLTASLLISGTVNLDVKSTISSSLLNHVVCQPVLITSLLYAVLILTVMVVLAVSYVYSSAISKKHPLSHIYYRTVVLIYKIHTKDPRSDAYRMSMTENIYLLSKCFKKDLKGKYTCGIKSIDTWQKDQFTHIGNAIDDTSKWILNPMADTHSSIRLFYLQFLTNLMQNNWHDLPRKQVEQASSRQPVSINLTARMKTIAIISIPWLIYIALKKTELINIQSEQVNTYIQMSLFTWTTLNLTILINPEIKESVKQVAVALAGVLGSSRPK